MKTLSKHILESFTPIKEEQQTVIENLNDNKDEVVTVEESVEKEKPSE
ncbi:hypothetical protein [Flavobacterium pectinovorum]|uniref:Uncharacterized protein n=1 Tax=Flavobacterium pectinovorum TaxID=29533 RepID=A0ABY1J048_9FLAO|nr:hypothetical protein [Flavobacterium pectinovorum]SHL64223.1 hypothetical protein SAMN05444387_1131 [Flavobacterium pectinovorum]